jgi:hypothetical protein
MPSLLLLKSWLCKQSATAYIDTTSQASQDATSLSPTHPPGQASVYPTARDLKLFFRESTIKQHWTLATCPCCGSRRDREIETRAHAITTTADAKYKDQFICYIIVYPKAYSHIVMAIFHSHCSLACLFTFLLLSLSCLACFVLVYVSVMYAAFSVCFIYFTLFLIVNSLTISLLILAYIPCNIMYPLLSRSHIYYLFLSYPNSLLACSLTYHHLT